jgi:hypothetical protein
MICTESIKTFAEKNVGFVESKTKKRTKTNLKLIYLSPLSAKHVLLLPHLS